MIKRCPFCAGELIANPNQEMFLEKDYVCCANKKCVSNGYPMTIKMLDEISFLKYRAENAEWAVQCALEHAPSYFWEMPASSTGKYHPAYTLGAGGLVRHTKAAVRIADALLRLEMYAPLAARKDEIIAALILHDSVKKGASGGQYTTIEHPLAAADHFQRIAQGLKYKGDIEFICGLIRAHMGQWNKDFDGNDVLPKPTTPHQQFVHLCDYLASRKFITITEDSGAPLK